MALEVLTYSLCMPIELTRLCSGACDYCPFPYSPHEGLISFHRLQGAVNKAQLLGASLIDFVAGENLNEIPEIIHSLRYLRLPTLHDYLNRAADMAQKPLEGKPIPVRLDIGPFPTEDWALLLDHFQGAKLLLTTVDTNVARGGRSKNPIRKDRNIVFSQSSTRGRQGCH